MTNPLVMLAPGDLNHIANIVKGYAIAIGVAFGIWIVWLWWKHARETARVARESRAKEIYAGYLALALANPALAGASMGMARDAGERLRYEWLVGYLLNAAEQILLIDPSPAWRPMLLRELARHGEHLSGEPFRAEGYPALSGALRALVDQVARPAGSHAAADPSRAPGRAGGPAFST